MQKIALTKIIREEALRAIVFASVLFALLFAGFGTLAYAADGGLFGNILNSILASGDWQAPGDGTVKNTLSLGGQPASAYVKIPAGDINCGNNSCIQAIDASGNISCTTP